MIHRLLVALFLLASTSCLGGAPPKGAATQGGSGQSAGGCGQFKIQTGADLDACKGKCRDQARDQMQSCSGAGCQAGAITGPCLGSCDDGKKAAQAASCYKE